jgi:hypothetical protein
LYKNNFINPATKTINNIAIPKKLENEKTSKKNPTQKAQ